MEMGKRCVCFSTFGPGVLKIVMPATNACQDRSPLVVLSGETDQSINYRKLHQRAPVREIFGLITKDATTLRSITNPKIGWTSVPRELGGIHKEN